MYSSHGGQRRGLLRPHNASHSGPVFRNWPLFGFLAGLVIFFYVFYIYQAQNAELALMREQYNVQEDQASDFKSQNIELKAKLEKYKQNEKALQEEKAQAETKLEECSNTMRSEKLRADNGKDDLKKVQAEHGECSAKLKSANDRMVMMNETIGAMRTVGVNNEALIVVLNQTIERLQSEMAALKGTDAVNPAQQSPKAPDTAVDSKADKLVISKPDGNKDDTRQTLAAPSVLRGSRKAEDNLTTRNPTLPQPRPLDPARLPDGMEVERPVGAGDRVKLESAKNQLAANEGNLVVPGGEYANIPEEHGLAQRSNEGAPDFENDEKRVNEPDV